MALKIALIAAPHIPVPPPRYGGTELVIANLARGLAAAGHEPVVYANRASTIGSEVRGCYDSVDWPPVSPDSARIKGQIHAAWALRDTLDAGFDVIHLHDAMAIPLTVFTTTPTVYTLHHPHEPSLSRLYESFSEVTYVTISKFQRRQEQLPRIETVHHGIPLEEYTFVANKQPFLSFLGRMVPVKGAHTAIEISRRTGIPLKLAGEIQPMFRDYWDAKIKPYVDGRLVEYLGEADHAAKTELLGKSMACLFPIQWDEPFGLVMIEAMACGTPVLAFRGGAVEEIVQNGINGWICDDLDDMAAKAMNPSVPAHFCRRDAEQRFSLQRMVAQYESIYMSVVGTDVPEHAARSMPRYALSQ